MRGGLRLNGGTSTGRQNTDNCLDMDNPNVRRREGRDDYACNSWTPYQTNVRGSASYTIPWADVLASVVFTSRPGVSRSANVTYTYRDVIWAEGSEWRAANTAGCPTTGAGAAPVGCLYGVTNNNISTNVLQANDLFGERISYVDVKFGKNFRFAGKRVNLGVDIYNFTNSDAILGYNSAYTIDNPATPAVEVNNWGTPTTLLAPRFARVTLQVDF